MLGFELLTLETGQRAETHVDDRLGLTRRKAKLVGQRDLGFVAVRRRTDDRDDAVDVVDRNPQAVHDVLALFRLAEQVHRAASDDVATVREPRLHEVAQGQRARLAAIDRQVDDRVRALQRRELPQLVQHHLGVFTALQLDHEAHAVAAGVVRDVRDADDPAVLHDLDDLGDDAGVVAALLRLVRDLREDDLGAVLRLLDVVLRAYAHEAATRGVGLDDAAATHDGAAGGEVRAGHKLEQLFGLKVRPLQQRDQAAPDLAQVVGRQAGRHAHGNAVRPVAKKVREARRQHGGLHARLVVVGLEVDRLLVEIRQNLHGDAGHARLRVTHGGGRVAVDGAEVPLAVHQRVAQREVLGHAHERRVDHRLTVGVVVTGRIARHLGALPVLGPRAQVQVVHRHEDAALRRLQAVTHVRQCAAVDDRKGVRQVRLLHFALDGARGRPASGCELFGGGRDDRFVVGLSALGGLWISHGWGLRIHAGAAVWRLRGESSRWG